MKRRQSVTVFGHPFLGSSYLQYFAHGTRTQRALPRANPLGRTPEYTHLGASWTLQQPQKQLPRPAVLLQLQERVSVKIY